MVYRFAQEHGLAVDENCKSLGRWSRFPIGIRGDKFQYPVIVNPDYFSYEQWAAKFLSGGMIASIPTAASDISTVFPVPLTSDELNGKKPMLRFHHLENFISTNQNFKGEIRFNDMAQEFEFNGFSWIKRRPGDNMSQMLADELSAALRPHYCGVTYDLMARLIQKVGLDHRYHPVEERLKNEVWDGKDRIKRLCDTLTPMDDFSRSLIRKWLIQCYAMFKNTGEYGALGDNIILYHLMLDFSTNIAVD